MKLITLILTGLVLLSAQSGPNPAATPAATSQDKQKAAARDHQTKKPQKAAQPQKAAPNTPLIPPGATQVEPNLYRSTDAQGKTWLYRRTPFGVSKWEDTPSPQAAVPDDALVTVSDLGDQVQFERKTPFGSTKWIRNKSELTNDEKALLARERQPAPAPAGNKAAEKQ
jgi:hypothetical protein